MSIDAAIAELKAHEEHKRQELADQDNLGAAAKRGYVAMQLASFTIWEDLPWAVQAQWRKVAQAVMEK